MNSLETIVGGMTLRDLAERSGRSLQEIVDYALGNGSAPKKKSSPSRTRAQDKPSASTNGSSAKASKRPSSRVVNTKTPGGRATYEAKIHEVLKLQSKDTWMLAQQIRKEVGGTPAQARAALNRLCENGMITYRGKARATTYQILRD